MRELIPALGIAAMMSMLLSAGNLSLLIPFSRRINLLDVPQGHKTHSLHTPLVGGIGIYIVVLFMVMIKGPWPDVSAYQPLVLFSGAVLLLGAIDDYRHLSFRTRFVVQAIVAALLCQETGIRIDSLGNLLGFGEIPLGIMSMPFTVFALVGAMNAMNMIDGLDGLAGGMALVSFGALALLAGINGQLTAAAMLLILSAAVAGFLVFNLRLPGRAHAHVFLGDAGSMVLGLMIGYFLIAFAQGEQRLISPVIALWLFAMPLLDVFVVMTRRFIAGQSLFLPGKDHFHHRLLNKGFSVGQTSALLVVSQFVLSIAGIAGMKAGISGYVMFYLAVVLFLVVLLLPVYRDRLAWNNTRNT